MRIGMMVGATGGSSLDELVATARELEEAGFTSLWMANIFGLDAIGALGIVGRETRSIELGTAVVPTYPRHPMAIAQAGPSPPRPPPEAVSPSASASPTSS